MENKESDNNGLFLSILYCIFVIVLCVCFFKGMDMLLVTNENMSNEIDIEDDTEIVVYYNGEEITFRDDTAHKLYPIVEDGIVYVPMTDTGLFLDKEIIYSDGEVQINDYELLDYVPINTETLRGSFFSNDDLMGYDYTVFFTWVPWCSDCLEEIDRLCDVELDTNIQLIGLTYEDIDVPLAEEKMKELGITTVYCSEEMSKYMTTNIGFIPNYIVLDDKSRVVSENDCTNIDEILGIVEELYESSCGEC